MKLSAAKLKSIDWKQLGLKHAEKVAVGLVGVMAVLVLFVPLFGGAFAKFDKAPEEIIQKAETTRQQILQSQWPEEEKQKYASSAEISEKVQEIKKLVPVAKYIPSIEILPPLYRKQEPRKEPKFLALLEPRAVGQHDYFSVIPDDQSGGVLVEDGGVPIDSPGDDVVPLGEDDDEDKIPDRFKRRGAAGGVGGAPGGLTPFPPGGVPGLGGEGFGGGQDYMAGMAGGDYMGAGCGGCGGYMGMGMYGGMASGPQMNGRGFRYTLLTGAVRLHEQRELVAAALGLPKRMVTDPSLNLVEIVDFNVARKEGAGPWPTVEEDQILDKSKSLEVLQQMSAFDIDPVNFGVTDPTITSPLPMRINGYWNERAVAHPRITDFVDNTEEGLELKAILTEYLAEQQDKNKALQEKLEQGRGGFKGLQRNMRGLTSQFASGPTGGAGGGFNISSFMSMYSQMGAGGPTGATRGPGQANQQNDQTKKEVEQITAAGTYLLFRYFDFDVEPGKTYQYRIRLHFKNPNYNRPVSELEDPNARLGETRPTPWSKATQTVVPKDTKYFLSRVQIPPGGRAVAAEVDIYQWKPDIGSVNRAERVRVRPGQYIGGEATNVEVLRTAVPSLEKEKFEFTSDEMLVDVEPGVEVEPSEHPDLALPRRANLRIFDEAMVLDETGGLEAIDPISSEDEEKLAEQEYTWERQEWEYLKDLPAEGELGGCGADPLSAYFGGGCGGCGGEGMTEGSRGRGRKARARRANKARKPGGMIPYGPGGMFGGGCSCQ